MLFYTEHTTLVKGQHTGTVEHTGEAQHTLTTEYTSTPQHKGFTNVRDTSTEQPLTCSTVNGTVS